MQPDLPIRRPIDFGLRLIIGDEAADILGDDDSRR
jgi:hypothetical protein